MAAFLKGARTFSWQKRRHSSPFIWAVVPAHLGCDVKNCTKMQFGPLLEENFTNWTAKYTSTITGMSLRHLISRATADVFEAGEQRIWQFLRYSYPAVDRLCPVPRRRWPLNFGINLSVNRWNLSMVMEHWTCNTFCVWALTSPNVVTIFVISCSLWFKWTAHLFF